MVFFFYKWVIRKLEKFISYILSHILSETVLPTCILFNVLPITTYLFIKENHVWSWSRVNSRYLGNKYNSSHYCVVYFLKEELYPFQLFGEMGK